MGIYIPPTLGESLRAARKRKKLTQAQLARDARVSRRHVAAVERGANVSVVLLLKLATALELTELTIDAVTLRFASPPVDSPPAETKPDTEGPAGADSSPKRQPG